MSVNDNFHRGLLPAGLGDMLPPDAAREAHAIETLTARFAAFGYQRVKPPLVEFEESLLGGPGAAMAAQTFRLMDPVSQRMMGVRTDMTVQVARIATTRLRDAPRPLRLSYAGNVIRVKGSALRPERQFAQAGVELIGSDAPEADAEAVLLAADALRAVGVKGLSVDLNLPTLVTALCQEMALSAATVSRLRRALDRKDEAAVETALRGESAERQAVFAALLAATGPALAGVALLRAIRMPDAARAEADRLERAVAMVHEAAPDLRLTIDPVEYRGLEYQTGVSFTLFALGARGELGRGGRYSAGYPEDGATEPATGFTLYMDAVLAAAHVDLPGRRLYVPAGHRWADMADLQVQGFVAVRGFAPVADPRAEARRLDCSHALLDGVPVAV